jgi:SAM-dependent methyltransferase
MSNTYNRNFYETRDASTSHFADRLSGIILDIFEPASAVDLGCGVGTMLRHLKRKGCSEVLGIEGPWVEISRLVIQETEFQHADLTRPITLNRTFDVAISLEVAEHLEEKYADVLVDSLCRLSPRIIFSAAIPHQGGMHHVNEQWQSYWARKFLQREYKAFDVIRPAIWNDRVVPTYYRQNCIVYVKASVAAGHRSLAPYEVRDIELLDRAHPEQYLSHVKNPMNVTYKQLLAYFPIATWAALVRATKRMIGH